MWLNGGPGCSSMIGLFQENGPCTFNNVSGSTPVLNPHSWNNHANMLYVDQPIGTGFSFGTDDANSTVTAAPFVWKLLQAFYAQFPKYENRDFGLFTESYGGHYGPEFALYLWVCVVHYIFQEPNRPLVSPRTLPLNWAEPLEYKSHLLLLVLTMAGCVYPSGRCLPALS